MENYSSINFKNTNDSFINDVQDTPLSKIFFSKDNINLLQNTIIQKIRNSNNNYLIDRQSDEEMIIIMRSIFLTNSKNNDTNIKLQIKELNNLVLEFCIPNIITNIKQHLQYLEDIDKPIIPIEPPKNVSSAGEKTLQPNFGFTKFQ
jgi:hypothetical protein